MAATKVSQETTIVENILSTLLQDIKTEFTRRNNQYNHTGLGTIANDLALTLSDSTGNKITAVQFKEVVDALYKISVNSNTLPSENSLINAEDYNDAVDVVNLLSGYNIKTVQAAAGCKGAC
jgi:hypothetical protein